MGRWARGLWPIVTVLAIAAVTVWLLYAVWRSPHRSDLAIFGAYAAALVTIAAGIADRVWRARTKQHAERPSARELDRLADLLAGAVADQWTRAATDRRLLEPEPIPVRWRRPSLPLVGPVSAAVASQQFLPLPGLAQVGPQRLRKGQIRDLHTVYGGLASGRLVIAGAPGSGKSGAAVLLVLAALKHREQVSQGERPLVPVPVMFTLHDWDPNTERVQDWLAARLQRTYPLLAGKDGTVKASALLAAGRIAVILDGLDEIPEQLRPVALRALSQQATFRLVLLTRSAEMEAAATEGLLEGAAAVELQDVDPATAASYLTRVQLDPPPDGWRELTDRLRDTPDSTIAQALASPLALTLVRDTYRGQDNVRELLDFSDAPDRGATREDIENHLLDRVLPAAYAPQPGEAPLAYDLQTAQRALSYIAAKMNQDSTRDLGWWRICRWSSAVPRVLATWLAVGLPLIYAVGPVVGPAAAIVVAPMVGMAIAMLWTSDFPKRIAPWRRWRQLNYSPLATALWAGSGTGLPVALLLGQRIGYVPGLIIGLAVGAGYGFVFGLGTVFAQPGADDASPFSPPASWKGDRTFGVVLGLMIALTCGLAGGLASSLTFGLTDALRFGLACGLAAGFTGLTYPEVWSASLAFAQLAVRRHTPILLVRFLEDARNRNVLRTVGPVYEFRHARLQDRLAGRAPPQWVKPRRGFLAGRRPTSHCNGARPGPDTPTDLPEPP